MFLPPPPPKRDLDAYRSSSTLRGFFSVVHTRVLPDTHYSLDVTSIELEKLNCFHFLLPKKSEILSELVIEFTPILRTQMK